MTNNFFYTLPERVAALRVLKRQVDAAWKDADGEVRDHLLSAYEQDGTDRIALRVGDMEVGKASVTAAKVEPVIIPGREAEAMAFLRENGLTEEVPRKGWQNHIKNKGGVAAHADTGEICEAIDFMPTKAPYIRYSGLKDETVRDAFEARGIEAINVLKLTGGNND